jgi:hypothetical protein
MTPEQYYLQLGRLVGNLHSLEFALRGVLYNADPPRPGDPSLLIQLHELRVGQTVPVNALTDYRTLEKLITAYNELVASRDAGLCVDTAVVDLRDAIAHGRVSSAEPAPDMMILKFGPEKSDQVTVAYAATMTEAWFKRQISRVYQEMMKVYSAGQLLAPDEFPGQGRSG